MGTGVPANHPACTHNVTAPPFGCVSGHTDLTEIVRNIRQDRVCLVQHAVQYEWLYAAIVTYADRSRTHAPPPQVLTEAPQWCSGTPSYLVLDDYEATC